MTELKILSWHEVDYKQAKARQEMQDEEDKRCWMLIRQDGCLYVETKENWQEETEISF
jgi:hypothetical protein